MKKILLLSILAISFLIGCSDRTDKKGQKKETISNWNYSIYIEVIDSCEYLVMDGSYSGSMIHKENCKNHLK